MYMHSVLDVNADTWEKEILQSDTLVVVDFWHEQCPWCKRLNCSTITIRLRLGISFAIGLPYLSPPCNKCVVYVLKKLFDPLPLRSVAFSMRFYLVSLLKPIIHAKNSKKQ